MIHPENAPSAEGVFSSYDFYHAAARGLLERGRYRGDAHYLDDSISLVGADGGTSLGYYRLSDYQAYCSRLFEYANPDYPAGADPDEQQRLLQIGRSVLGIELYDASHRLQHHSYTACWPADLHPGSTIGFLYFYPEGDWHHAPFEDQTLWTPDAPTIVCAPEGEAPQILGNPSEDPHLAQIFQELQNV